MLKKSLTWSRDFYYKVYTKNELDTTGVQLIDFEAQNLSQN